MLLRTPFGEEQMRDTQVSEVIDFLNAEELPTDTKQTKKVASQ